MATPYFILTPDTQDKWDDIISTVFSYVNDNHSDANDTYDYVTNHLGLPFVENKQCFDIFWKEWNEAYLSLLAGDDVPDELTGWN
jgi:hypothetical protein